MIDMPVNKVMGLNPSKSQGKLVLAMTLDKVGVLVQEGGGALPDGPGTGGGEPCFGVGGGEAAVVGGDEVAALHGGDLGEVVVPGVGIDSAGALLVEPKELPPA